MDQYFSQLLDPNPHTNGSGSIRKNNADPQHCTQDILGSTNGITQQWIRTGTSKYRLALKNCTLTSYKNLVLSLIAPNSYNR